jgi:alkylation response protein AidB-like acyl-CoA dehydrogenase
VCAAVESIFGVNRPPLARAAAEFAEQELGRDLDAREDRGELDEAGWRRCAEFGIQGLPMPEEYGAIEVDLPTAVRVLEGLGYGCRDNGLLFALGAQIWSVQMPILVFGTDEQRRRYLPALTDGGMKGAHCVTEPEAGSDVFSLRTSAVADGEGYVLNGRKTFSTNAPLADLFLVVATLDRDKGAAGLTAFLLERDTPGLDVEPLADEKMGLRTSAMGDVVIQDCRVDAGQVLGRPGGGSAVFGVAMEWERCCILAPALGRMQRQLEDCVRYARTRRQFGRPIGKNQAVADKVVGMHQRLEQSRLLTYRAAWMREQGMRLTLEPSQVKLQVSESWVQNSLDALQLHGGAGYLRGMGIERELRDALASRIYSGTSEIQRTIIARFIGL